MHAPITMPAVMEIAPSVMRLMTRPRAVTWAPTQPRYERTIATEQSSSTPLP